MTVVEDVNCPVLWGVVFFCPPGSALNWEPGYSCGNGSCVMADARHGHNILDAILVLSVCTLVNICSRVKKSVFIYW